jgi:hypothetical protein
MDAKKEKSSLCFPPISVAICKYLSPVLFVYVCVCRGSGGGGSKQAEKVVGAKE